MKNMNKLTLTFASLAFALPLMMRAQKPAAKHDVGFHDDYQSAADDQHDNQRHEQHGFSNGQYGIQFDEYGRFIYEQQYGLQYPEYGRFVAYERHGSRRHDEPDAHE